MWVSWGSDWSAKQEHSWTSGGIRFSESVKYFWSWYRHLILVSNSMFFGMGNHGESCGTIFISLRLIWRPRNGWRGCRRPRTSSRSEIINLNLTLDFGVKPHVFGHGKSFETIFRSLRSIWRSITGWRGYNKWKRAQIRPFLYIKRAVWINLKFWICWIWWKEHDTRWC